MNSKEEEKVPLVPNNDDLNNNINGNQFGFGVAEEREELNPDIFEDEVDIKKAFKYEQKQKFDKGVEKEFEKMKSGDMPNIFYDEDEDDEFFRYAKMPNSLDEFD
jgi:hypothetical protein